MVSVASVLVGFSPYENYLNSGQQTHVMLAVSTPTESADTVAAKLATLTAPEHQAMWAAAEISNVAVFQQNLQGATWFMVYFAYDTSPYHNARQVFAELPLVKQLTTDLADHLQPHPRAVANGHTWLQMEWMCYIRGSTKDAPTQKRLARISHNFQVRASSSRFGG